MAKDPQTPTEEELARAERDAEPQPDDTTGDDAELEGVVEDVEASEADAEALENPEADALAVRVEELEQALAESKDQAARAAAEAQNVRRRAEQDVEKARKFALEKFVKELLPVIDSLEKALESMQEGASEVHREGVSMTLKLQLDVLNKFGVEAVDPQGEPFDPQVHEAMTMVPNSEVEPNTVIEVMQKGYLLNGRLVRPAMVVVSQAAN
ncbi:nucleotide exchange factor GrpE [Chromohalobacter salexigens]|uniref:Protein GrpE n=1 Tax=Chromohalobacter moromii TaxID=2860329 RepID=A0A9X2X2Z2_9GAMM|nr:MULTISPECIES: nucleotide exchange factor GrpE [Chromohalobacter]NWO10462.1 nucleotide exchange factor GrpE [Chromohalobacter salexigens]CDQ34586.1 HSP-70 cofactor [Virgibacillus halodenitrificans]MCK2043550.1 nucleotide exchange factor GrpE [Chromohalobacter moromii]MCK2045782.1 nucleotide exchange factor GrpE [Chromohalobacter moromii]MCT8505795.1 nucleotide exchange factor GrpE [Chromohalobacter moromii]